MEELQHYFDLFINHWLAVMPLLICGVNGARKEAHDCIMSPRKLLSLRNCRLAFGLKVFTAAILEIRVVVLFLSTRGKLEKREVMLTEK